MNIPSIHKIITILVLTITSTFSSFGQTPMELDLRLWTSADGKNSFKGKYISSNPENKTVTIQKTGKIGTYPTKAFSTENRDWISKRQTLEEFEKISLHIEFEILQILPNGVLATDFIHVDFRENGSRSREHGVEGIQFVKFRTAEKDLVDGQGIKTRAYPSGTYKYTATSGANKTIRSWELLSDIRKEIFTKSPDKAEAKPESKTEVTKKIDKPMPLSISGRWQWKPLNITYTIAPTKNGFTLKMQAGGTDALEEEVTAKLDGKRIIIRPKTKSPTGDYWILDEQKNLLVMDEQGIVYKATAF